MLDIDAIVKAIDPEKDYTAKEINEMLGVSTVSIIGAVRRGKLPARRVFNKFYFKGRTIRNYILGEDVSK